MAHPKFQPQPDAGVARAAHPIMFGVLTGLALLVFAPCVLVPLWLEGEQLREHEAVLAATIARLESQSARNKVRADALRDDPLVIERVVRRDLNFRSDSEQIVQWPMGELVAAKPHLPPNSAYAVSVEVSPPSPLGEWMASLGRWLPAWPWRELFASSPNRELLLLMAGGLLLAAFFLYTPPVGCRPAVALGAKKDHPGSRSGVVE